MRENEPQSVVSLFAELGIDVRLIDAKEEFFTALKGITDPEKMREAITQTFYKKVFGRVVKESGSKCLLQGTILTDIDEAAGGIKRHHNVFEQIGIDPEEVFGYKIIEPLVQLRKSGVRKVAKALGLSESMYNRMPFPGPGLATRVIGEATPERIELIRRATAIVERELAHIKAFQYLAILPQDRFTGMRDGKRLFGQQIQIRCWDSDDDGRTGKPTRLPRDLEDELAREILVEIPEIVDVTFSRATKPRSTIEAI
jgi:GMP synthase (glutamine-hydrolysing)